MRDVVAHIISYDDLGPTAFLGRFARGRFNPDQVNQVGVDEYARLAPDELLAELKGHVRHAGLTAGSGPDRPGRRTHPPPGHPPALRAPREVPAERLAAALPFARVAPPIRAFSRARGLRLIATDVGWTSGSGPVVEGPAEPLLLAMAGRADALDELSGPGQAILADRVA